MEFIEQFKLILKGIPLGVSLVLPGLSFGTVALILKIYYKILISIRNLELKYLFVIGIGIVIGVFASTHTVAFIMASFQSVTYAFLMGLILFSVRVTLKETKKVTLSNIGLMVLGLILAYNFGNRGIGNEVDLLLPEQVSIIMSGAISSSAMILPGLSGATFLIMLGAYDLVIEGVNSFDFQLMTLFGVGIIVGLLLFSWIISYLLNNYRCKMMFLLSGLIIGSSINVVPNKIGIFEVSAFAAGSALVYVITKD